MMLCARLHKSSKHSLIAQYGALIHGVCSTIGSTHLDWLSFVHNQEINAPILGHDFGTQMQVISERD
jgi:hypothetical protein